MPHQDALDDVSNRNESYERTVAREARRQQDRILKDRSTTPRQKRDDARTNRRKALKSALGNAPKVIRRPDSDRRFVVIKSVVADDGLWLEVMALDADSRPVERNNGQAKAVVDVDGVKHILKNPIRVDDPFIGDNPVDHLIELMEDLRRHR